MSPWQEVAAITSIEPCLCGGALHPLFAIDSAKMAGVLRVMLMRCQACGSLMPRPSASVQGAYDGYYTQAARRGPVRRRLRGALDLTRRAYMDRSTPPNARRVLDFGCGAGGYLDRVTSPDRTCFGTDLIEARSPQATWVWLVSADLEAAAPFDWITLGHVLEHLADPAAAVSRLSTCLAPGAALWIATPNANSFLFACAGRWARDVDYPRHLTIFSRQALEHLLARDGLTATFTSPPRLNAILNTVTTIRNILRDDEAPIFARIKRAVATLTALALHVAKPRRLRDRTCPELVATFRCGPSAPPLARSGRHADQKCDPAATHTESAPAVSVPTLLLSIIHAVNPIQIAFPVQNDLEKFREFAYRYYSMLKQ